LVNKSNDRSVNQRKSIVARGGTRTGAGRKPGALTKKTREIAEKAQEEGITPLEVMLGTMRALWEKADLGETIEEGGKTHSPIELRLMAADVAQKAAPFIHPKLSNVEANVKGSLGVTIVSTPLDEAL
jgi:hypothetical protein